MWMKDIENWYKQELYSKDDVKIFVLAKMINTEEYKQITNEDYIA